MGLFLPIYRLSYWQHWCQCAGLSGGATICAIPRPLVAKWKQARAGSPPNHSPGRYGPSTFNLKQGDVFIFYARINKTLARVISQAIVWLNVRPHPSKGLRWYCHPRLCWKGGKSEWSFLCGSLPKESSGWVQCDNEMVCDYRDAREDPPEGLWRLSHLRLCMYTLITPRAEGKKFFH